MGCAVQILKVSQDRLAKFPGGGQGSPGFRLSGPAVSVTEKLLRETLKFAFYGTSHVMRITLYFFPSHLKCQNHSQLEGHIKTGGGKDLVQGPEFATPDL